MIRLLNLLKIVSVGLFNKYLFKISNLIEKFHLNVVVANFYEITHLINDSITKDISTRCLKETQIKLMRIMIPFVPHIACECLHELEGKSFYLKSDWPKVNESLLEESSVTIIGQINGKKRGLLSTKKDIDEKEVVAKAEGEASRFVSIYNEYAKAKEVTQERMYLETMEKVLGDIEKVIIEKNAGSGVVPYLPLPELSKKKDAN